MQFKPGLTITKGTKGKWPSVPGKWPSVPLSMALGALESRLLFSYSLTSNGLGALSCPFKMALEIGAL